MDDIVRKFYMSHLPTITKLVYIVYIRERYFFSPMCAFENVIKKVEVFKVDVQKGTLKFREKK